MEYLAHSQKDGFPPQSYTKHVADVKQMATDNARSAARYASRDAALLVSCAELTAEYHDLGKLDPLNQDALHEEDKHSPLPINHVDAGASLMKRIDGDAALAAITVYSHHHGLPDWPDEQNRNKNCFRDHDYETRTRTDGELDELQSLHAKLTGQDFRARAFPPANGDGQVLTRMQLSCLSDADHTDTAIHYGKYPRDQKAPLLRAQERLDLLDAHIKSLVGSDERSRLRSQMYWECRNAAVADGIAACDSPVGSGKTTAVMAHLLHQAIAREARRIFVVLPFTNIISQSVDIYRDILTLPGEDPTEVVAELHHRADFDDEMARAFNAQWRAPIVVTTAVAFFETLASNRPSTLRRYHELPGSVIFVDEAHAALPVKLLPVAWRWMQILAEEWSCYWVLASGSLVRFWTIEGLCEKERAVPQIVSDGLRQELAGYEQRRIRFSYLPKALSRAELVSKVNEAPGPRLLIMNTVQNAAVLAEDFRCACGQSENALLHERRILHLSTALSAEDRERVLKEVKSRLKEKSDTDWILVATSCVEAGVDFSFRSGFREIASLLSLLQTAGRINRGGNDSDAEIQSFSMQDDSMLTKNPSVENAAHVLTRFFQRRIPITPELSTRSIRDELNRANVSNAVTALMKAEKTGSFETVEKLFRVIESETALVVADAELKNKLRYGQCDWKEIQRKGISVHLKERERRLLPELVPGIYDWNLRYNDFLGIMAGRLDCLKVANDFLAY